MPWLKVPAPIPPPASNRFGLDVPSRPKWEWPGNESALSDADKKTAAEQELIAADEANHSEEHNEETIS